VYIVMGETILSVHNRFMIGCIMLHGPTSCVFREDVNG
jgi:hypothetical protein